MFGNDYSRYPRQGTLGPYHQTSTMATMGVPTVYQQPGLIKFQPTRGTITARRLPAAHPPSAHKLVKTKHKRAGSAPPDSQHRRPQGVYDHGYYNSYQPHLPYRAHHEDGKRGGSIKERFLQFLSSDGLAEGSRDRGEGRDQHHYQYGSQVRNHPMSHSNTRGRDSRGYHQPPDNLREHHSKSRHRSSIHRRALSSAPRGHRDPQQGTERQRYLASG